MQSVINANWPLFLDGATHQYYLFTGQRWVTSNDLKSGWKETASLPAKMAKIPSDPQWASLKSYMGATSAHAGKAPAVYFTNVPAELIVYSGKPVFTAISRHQAHVRNQHRQRSVHLFANRRVLLPERRSLVFGARADRSMDLRDRSATGGFRHDPSQ
jgi:hypothetical protein